jgi:hypothetical protein
MSAVVQVLPVFLARTAPYLLCPVQLLDFLTQIGTSPCSESTKGLQYASHHEPLLFADELGQLARLLIDNQDAAEKKVAAEEQQNGVHGK